MDETVRVFDGVVYRSGKRRHQDMTPRPDRDVSPNLSEAGLSTWRDLESAIQIDRKGVMIDIAKLDPNLLGCFQDELGHVSIVPVDAEGKPDMMTLAEWAATKEKDVPHALTVMVLEAIVERNVRRPS